MISNQILPLSPDLETFLLLFSLLLMKISNNPYSIGIVLSYGLVRVPKNSLTDVNLLIFPISVFFQDKSGCLSFRRIGCNNDFHRAIGSGIF